jgi:hypothetical protein
MEMRAILQPGSYEYSTFFDWCVWYITRFMLTGGSLGYFSYIGVPGQHKRWAVMLLNSGPYLSSSQFLYV